MKKLIAIAVVLALVAGVAFAEINVSADVFGMVNIIEASSFKKNAAGDTDPVKASGAMKRLRLNASGQDESGMFGGYLRLEPASWGFDKNAIGQQNSDPDKWFSFGDGVDGNAWWKPIDQFKLTIGGNGGDGFWGADGVARWGFYQTAGDVGVAKEGWAFGNSFYAGFGSNGGFLTITPIEALEINFGVPFFYNEEAYKVFSKFEAQVAVNIAGAGRLAITYAGNEMDKDALDDGTNPLPKLYAYFGLNAIENLGIDIGIGYEIGDTYEPANSGYKITRFNPLAFGVGANFNSGAFGIKARVQATLNGSTKNEGGGRSIEYSDGYGIVFDILPSYAVNDNLKILLSAGLNIGGGAETADNAPGAAWDAKTVADPVVGWHVQPYVIVKNFYAGIRIDSSGEKFKDGMKDPKNGEAFVNFSIPVGIAFSF